MLRRAIMCVAGAFAMTLSSVATTPQASADAVVEHSRETVPLSLAESEYRWLCGETTVFANDGGEIVRSVVTQRIGATIRTTRTGVARGVTGHLSDGTPVRIRHSSTENSVLLVVDGGGFDILRSRINLRFVFIGPDGFIGTWKMRWDFADTSRESQFGSCIWSGQ